MIDHHRIFQNEPRAWAPGYLVMECDVLVKPFENDALLIERERETTAAIRKAMRHERRTRGIFGVRINRAICWILALLAFGMMQ